MNTPLVSCKPSASTLAATRVMLLLVDGVSLTTVSSTLEPFQLANRYMRRIAFDVQLVSLDGRDPTTQAGIPIPCQAASGDVLGACDMSGRPDLVILCCGQSVDGPSQTLLQRFVRKLFRASIPVFALGAACEVIAGTGILKTRTCAAHWKSLASLGERFPDLQFDNVLFASDGRFTSCAGELAAFDLIVDFIEQVCGARIAGEICNHFLACGKRSGETRQYLGADALICEDERFQKALSIMVDNIETPITTAELANRLGLSTRQVERIFAKNGFQSPLKYYVRLRLNRARQLVEQTKMPLIEIALSCGFESQTNFSKNYKRAFGKTPYASRVRTARPQTQSSSGS
ncbi:GlxA family transcriptional regulator [Roseovarius sp. 2305UL8-3]|uniref:GlxA family transcriptional regulator n=1 Tax=Roseovarius conchicola TaxID=3121636 RepID=UPI0035290590